MIFSHSNIVGDAMIDFNSKNEEKNEIAKLLSWFLMLSKIMTQPYDDTFNIEKEHRNYKPHHVAFMSNNRISRFRKCNY